MSYPHTYSEEEGNPLIIRYTARVLENISNGGDYWNYQMIGVFRKEGDKEEKVGEYKRNYSSFMDTFHHFTLNGKDLAVFSPDYTCTRIMSLPDCKDIGGEEPHGHGFCPTGYYIPTYVAYEMTFKDGKKTEYRVYDPEKEDYESKDPEVKRLSSLLFTPFGFISGCVWGDDTSWKIEFLDLAEADKGIVKRDARFGYIELPGKMKLKDAINVDGYEDGGYPNIRIATESYYNLKTGKKCE